jgi:hypothetical protein
VNLGEAISGMFAPLLGAVLIFGGAGMLYATVMILLRPWRPANRDDSAPFWKFLLLGFGFRLRRHQGLAAGAWAVLIASVAVAAVYHRIATYQMLTDPDGFGGLLPAALLSDDEVITIDLVEAEPGRSCSVVQFNGSGPQLQCALTTGQGRVELRIQGFDVTCEVTCTSGAGWQWVWEYSRGPAPAGGPRPADAEI